MGKGEEKRGIEKGERERIRDTMTFEIESSLYTCT